MALTDKKYEDFYRTTGSDGDKISSKNLEKIEKAFEFSASHGFHDIIDDPFLGPLVYMIQQMQDELDYLRTEISSNKSKVGMTLGTSGSTALAGDTTTISTAQANAITANTAKASMVLGTTSKTALAGDTTTISTSQALNISTAAKLTSKIGTASQANISKSTVITFGEFTTTGSGKTLAYSLPITVVETDTSGKVAVTTTKTGSITLT